MRIVMWYHSLRSDWNHGNAHFLRGVVTDLLERGHDVVVYEPEDSWSARNLVADSGALALRAYRHAYPTLTSELYDLTTLDLDAALRGADLVLVHEWNPPDLVQRIGAHRASDGDYALLFHDTHHRAVSDPGAMAAYDLQHYDGVLAFGDVIRRMYVQNGWTDHAWTWHEAADTRIFRPLDRAHREGDVVWVGNWGDAERTAELHEFLIDPVRDLKLSARVFGVRYPDEALQALQGAGIEYAGYLPNYFAPQVFSHFAATVHVPRQPYVHALPGIPTIRVFEALACGIPLVSAPWNDAEHLFTPGRDFLMASNGREMRRLLRDVVNDDALSHSLAAHGLATILARHTCAHRVDELLDIVASLSLSVPATSSTGTSIGTSQSQ